MSASVISPEVSELALCKWPSGQGQRRSRVRGVRAGELPQSSQVEKSPARWRKRVGEVWTRDPDGRQSTPCHLLMQGSFVISEMQIEIFMPSCHLQRTSTHSSSFHPYWILGEMEAHKGKMTYSNLMHIRGNIQTQVQWKHQTRTFSARPSSIFQVG